MSSEDVELSTMLSAWSERRSGFAAEAKIARISNQKEAPSPRPANPDTKHNRREKNRDKRREKARLKDGEGNPKESVSEVMTQKEGGAPRDDGLPKDDGLSTGMMKEQESDNNRNKNAVANPLDSQIQIGANSVQEKGQESEADKNQLHGVLRKKRLLGEDGLAKDAGFSTATRKEGIADGNREQVPTAKDDGEGASQETRARTASFTAPCSGSPSPAQVPPTTKLSSQNSGTRQIPQIVSEGPMPPTGAQTTNMDNLSSVEDGLRIRVKLHLDARVNLEIKDVVDVDGRHAIEVLIAKNTETDKLPTSQQHHQQLSDEIPKSTNVDSLETRHNCNVSAANEAETAKVPSQEDPQEESGVLKTSPATAHGESELLTLNGSSWQELSTIRTSEIQRFLASSEDVMQIPQGIPNGDRLDSIFVPSGVPMISQSIWSMATANPTTPTKKRANEHDGELDDDLEEKKTKTEDPEVSNLFDELDVLPSCPLCQCPFQNPISYFHHYEKFHKNNNELTPCHHARCQERFRSERLFSQHVKNAHSPTGHFATFNPPRTSTPMRDTDEDIEEDIEETTSDWNPMLEAKAGGTQSKTKRRDNK